MKINDKENKKRGFAQTTFLLIFMGLAFGCSQSGSSSGPSLVADASSPGITEVRMSEGIINKSACSDAWGNTRADSSGEQVNCSPKDDKAPYQRVFFD